MSAEDIIERHGGMSDNGYPMCVTCELDGRCPDVETAHALVERDRQIAQLLRDIITVAREKSRADSEQVTAAEAALRLLGEDA